MTKHLPPPPSPKTPPLHKKYTRNPFAKSTLLFLFQPSFWNTWARDTHKILASLILILIIAAFIITTTVTSQIPNAPYSRHIDFLILSLFVIIGCSLLTPKIITILSLIATICLFPPLIGTLISSFGQEFQGANRSFFVPFFNTPIQPHILITPFFIIIISKLISLWRFDNSHIKVIAASVLAFSLIFIIFSQPDVDTGLFFASYLLIALFFGGIKFSHFIKLIGILATAAALITVAFPHTRARISSFFLQFSPSLQTETDKYSQSSKAYDAISHGGLFGSSPPYISIPEGHNDLILANIAQFYGFFGVAFILILLLALTLTTLHAINNLSKSFPSIACITLFAAFIIPASFHTLSSFSLTPVLGQPLPFISTGGSSTMAFAVSCGFILALLRQHTSSHSPSLYPPILP